MFLFQTEQSLRYTIAVFILILGSKNLTRGDTEEGSAELRRDLSGELLLGGADETARPCQNGRMVRYKQKLY